MGTALGQNTGFKVSLVSSETVTAGTLWTWGYDAYGQLGNGTTTDYSSPIQIGALTNWSSIAFGSTMAAIKTDGTLWTCGYNRYGQLGNGTVVYYSSPIQVGSLTNWSKVSVGGNWITAIKTDGTLWAWGRGSAAGQLGNGTTINYSSPIQIGSLTNWSSVSSSGVAVGAVKTDGTLWTWGYGADGLIGNGTTISYSSPIQVGSLTNWSKVSMGTWHSAALKTNGTLWSWGLNNWGQLGNGTSVYYSSPIQVGSLTTWNDISVGIVGHNLATKTDGTLWSWGRNHKGQLGNGTTTDYSSPIQVGSLSNWGYISSGIWESAAIPSSTQTVKYGQDTYYGNTLWGWGSGQAGALGNSATNNYSSPIQIGSLTNWSKVSSGFYAFLGIKTDGTLWGWGDNRHGGIGNGTNVAYSSPVQVGSLTNWSEVRAGTCSLSIKTDGTLWAWGRNSDGQLGNGTVVYYLSPIQVGSLTTWSKISVSQSGTCHSAAIKTDGTMWTWGSNSNGQLGNGTTINYSSPIQVGALTNWNQIACGYTHTVAVKTDGTLWTWGSNSNGTLGNETRIDYSSPIQIGSLTTWSQASAGNSTSVVKTDGTLWTWGFNGDGQLGNGTTINYSSPVQVGALTNWSNVQTNSYSGFGLKTDGTIWKWGDGNSGKIGNGTTISYSSPVQVGSLTNWSLITSGALNSFAIPFTLVVDRQQDLGQRYVSKDYLLDVYPTIASATGARTSPGLFAWGDGYAGGLGNGTTLKYSSPIQIGALTNWKSVGAGYFAFFAIKTDGTWWSCGYNNMGTLGNGTTIRYSSPIQIGALTNWAKVYPNDRAVFAIKTNGTLWACGYGSSGSLGNGASGTVKYSSPIQIGALTNWSSIGLGNNMSFTNAVKTDGTLWAWGSNSQGQLGNGTITNYSSPIQIGALTNWRQVAIGGQCSFGVKTDGTMWSWGWGARGQLGLNYILNYVSVPTWGTNISYSSPVQIGSLTNWKQVASGGGTAGYCGFAVKTDGTLWSWGANDYGQLGNGTTIDYASPIQVGSLTNWKTVIGGTQNFLAIKTDGTLWGCGYNPPSRGMLGNGSGSSYSSPIQIGSLTNWKQVSINYQSYGIADGYY